MEFTFATSLCNKLDKINPPPFVTVPVQAATNAPKDIGVRPSYKEMHKLNSLTKTRKHEIAARYFVKEIDLLNGFIERKGTQLRLEKALQLSSQILKLGMRWKSNEFFKQMERFVQSGNQNYNGRKANRLPSRQWAQWIAYLCLRESALLVKMKLECERTVKFWLGLISSSHHWGDSLVVTGILSRLWHLSKIIFTSISFNIYPNLFDLVKTLKPNDAPSWPSEEFKIPQDLKQWLKSDMCLSYSDNDIESECIKKDHSINLEPVQKARKRDCFVQINCEDTKNNNSVSDEEDLGVVVKVVKVTPISKSYKPVKRVKNKSGCSLVFKNYKKLQKTDDGRKKLHNKIKKYLKSQTDEKAKLKLRNILRCISVASNEDLDKLNHLIKKFQEYSVRCVQ